MVHNWGSFFYPKNTQQTTVFAPFFHCSNGNNFFLGSQTSKQIYVVLRDLPEKNLGGCHIDITTRVKEGKYVCCKFEIIKTNTLQGTNISTTKALLSP